MSSDSDDDFRGIPGYTRLIPPPAETQPNLSTTEGDMYELVQHSVKVDVDSLNAKYLDQQQGLWEAMERSRWWGDVQAF